MAEVPKRRDPRTENTRAAMIETAEALFAEFGFNGVSLRQIAAAMGAGNTNVVVYHFGDKDTLAEAIFRDRLPAIEARRAALLQYADAQGRGHDLGVLLDVFFRPFLELVNSKGRHAYLSFIMGVINAGRLDLRISLNADFPVSALIVGRMSALGEEDFVDRMTVVMAMIDAAMRLVDLRKITTAQREELYTKLLGMMTTGPFGRAPAPIKKKIRTRRRKST